MRTSRIATSASGLVPFGHLGWRYRDETDFRARAWEYMRDGIARRQWVELVGPGGEDELREEVCRLDPAAEAALVAGDVGVCPISEFYAYAPGSDVVDPFESVERRVVATEAAVAAGFEGFRAVVDATAVARTPSQRDAFARFEHLIDAKMSTLPVSALCAYDARELGDEAVAEMACLHPLLNEGSSPFRLYATGDPSLDFALGGEIDFSCDELFETTIRRTMPLHQPKQRIAVDGRSLTFIDHRSLLTLDRWAGEHGVQVHLLGARPLVGRLLDVLGADLERLRAS